MCDCVNKSRVQNPFTSGVLFSVALGDNRVLVLPVSLACLPITKYWLAGLAPTLTFPWDAFRAISARGHLDWQCRDFPHIIERNLWLCAGMSAMMRPWTVSNCGSLWGQRSTLPPLFSPGMCPMSFFTPFSARFLIIVFSFPPPTDRSLLKCTV